MTGASLSSVPCTHAQTQCFLRAITIVRWPPAPFNQRQSSNDRRLQWGEASGICRAALFGAGDVAERLKAAVC